ncbi:hypothetical protein QMK33_11465 [Hymenobacter sp. H14-R3]|uniref:hypothetical protein n=1 Tax=Hymenobacter sp. H14-R3 TaxID=3046308 RepID=UPI0024B8C801|nr:hypothetical protein [Hymenobacter sp. H14-R3]MDJ0365772.1 hypothetical protein [Hymenobacter sp. H14-R3]
MLFLKRIVTIIALLYLLVALLFLFFPAVRSSMSVFGVEAYTLGMEVNLLLGLTWVGVFVTALLMLVEKADSGLLRRNVSKQEQKINELKAQLFDAKKPPMQPQHLPNPTVYPPARSVPPTPGPAAPTYPQAYNTPPTPPPTY